MAFKKQNQSILNGWVSDARVISFFFRCQFPPCQADLFEMSVNEMFVEIPIVWMPQSADFRAKPLYHLNLFPRLGGDGFPFGRVLLVGLVNHEPVGHITSRDPRCGEPGGPSTGGNTSGNTPQCEFGALVSLSVSPMDSQSLADMMFVNLLQLVPRLLKIAH